MFPILFIKYYFDTKYMFIFGKRHAPRNIIWLAFFIYVHL